MEMKYVIIENLMGGYGVIHGEYDSIEEAIEKEMELNFLNTITLELISEKDIEKLINEGVLSR